MYIYIYLYVCVCVCVCQCVCMYNVVPPNQRNMFQLSFEMFPLDAVGKMKAE